METGGLFIKDPISEEPIGFDWTAYLAGLGESVTIADSEFFLEVIGGAESPAALTLEDDSVQPGGRQTQVFLVGGTRNVKYRLTNRITTTGDRPAIDERKMTILVQHK